MSLTGELCLSCRPGGVWLALPTGSRARFTSIDDSYILFIMISYYHFVFVFITFGENTRKYMKITYWLHIGPVWAGCLLAAYWPGAGLV